MAKRLASVLDIACTLLVTAAAGTVLWRAYGQNAVKAGTSVQGDAPSYARDVDGLVIDAGVITNTRGTGDVALVEFSDYECQFCAQHARMTEPKLVKQFVETGVMRHIVLNYPLSIHADALKASEAAECAARQGRFWEMHDRLFADNSTLDFESLRSRARDIGADASVFDSCLLKSSTALKVKSDMVEGRRLGVDATPAFFVGRIRSDGSVELLERLVGALPFDEFARTINKILYKPVVALAK
jgi:protein-disulfide isomerase